MTMSIQSVPHLRENAVAEVAAKVKPAETKAPELPPLGRAAESGDGAVQNLLSHRAIHAANGDEDKVAAIDDKLAAIGLTVK